MLEPVHCGPLPGAPLLPKLRGCFAEFLGNASSAGLRILSSSTCVGLRYGYGMNDSGFSRHAFSGLRYLKFAPRRVFPSWRGFASATGTALAPVSPFPAPASRACPHSSVIPQYRNLHLLSIGYGSRPRLRPRLAQGRSALPWRPWIFGLEDSHLHLATHSGILSSVRSTAPSGTASSRTQCSSTIPLRVSLASAARFSPGHFRRRASRPVSYYALFECVAASEPTSWLSWRSHILFHLTRTSGP